MSSEDRGVVISDNPEHEGLFGSSFDSRFQIKYFKNATKNVGALIPRTRRGITFLDTTCFDDPWSETTQTTVGDIAQATSSLWPSSTTIVAYPLNGKESRPLIMMDRFLQGGSNRVLMTEIYENGNPKRPQGFGLCISNPPYDFEGQIQRTANYLSELLNSPKKGRTYSRVSWLTPFDLDYKEHATDGPNMLSFSPEWQKPVPDPEVVQKILGADSDVEDHSDEVDPLDRLNDWVPVGAEAGDYKGLNVADTPPPTPTENITEWYQHLDKIGQQDRADMRRMYAWIRQNRKFKD
jgi:hypothetical protein